MISSATFQQKTSANTSQMLFFLVADESAMLSSTHSSGRIFETATARILALPERGIYAASIYSSQNGLELLRIVLSICAVNRHQRRAPPSFPKPKGLSIANSLG